MAEAFLQVVLDNLNSFIQGELVLLFGFKKEFEKLSSTFSTIQAVLEDAQEKQQKEKALENWLQKLNAAAYEVDDILDECKTEAARLKQSCVLARYHPRIVTFRYKVGKRMKEMKEKLDAIAEERTKFHLVEKIAERQPVGRETGCVLNEPEVYGRDKEGDEIVQILINNVNAAQELLVIPIIGIGGLGKTTLAQMVFNNPRVTEHFDLKIWVCVSDDFDEKRLIKAILESIPGSSLDVENLSPLQKKLQALLNGKRYLLVLDDVWNEDQEKWIKLRAVLNVGARGASVLVTTRLEKVGSIMGTLEPYQLSKLSQEDCWFLFMQRAFGHRRDTNPKLVPIGKEIVKKCGGVPLAAKTLGGLLRFKREEIQWELVRDSDIWNLPQDENSILPALRLSYHHLPIDLRQCFMYCAVFTKDTIMKKEELISLWMAHDFLQVKGNLEPEAVGDQVWKELYLRSFFQEVEEDEYGNTYFKMHDLIHDLASSLFSTHTSSSRIRQLNKGHTHIVSIGFTEVVSSYSPSLLNKFVSLRVLVLSDESVERLSSSIGDLIHLRYLDLSFSYIQALPNRLCKLQNLQTLKLNCHSLSRLPKQTSTISSLRNLLLDGCPLNSTPPRIGSMTCLKNLDTFVVGKNKSHQLGELQNLHLCGSLTIKHLERVKNGRDAKEANLSAKANLQSLTMSWDEPHIYESEEAEVLEALKPHLNLKALSISGFGGFRFPDWMINGSVLKNAVVIEIHGCKKCSCLPPFGELPGLKRLLLSNGSEGIEYVEEDAHSEIPTIRFPSLRRLDITNFPNLKGLLKKEAEEQFPMLEVMNIWDCPEFVFPALSSVKTLRLIGTSATNSNSISKLSSLTSLHMSHNCEATSLPDEMFKSLSNLESMAICLCTRLKELPTSLASLNALRCLDIVICGALESLPEQGLEGLTSLTNLTVSFCEMLKSLPEGMKHLTALTSLTIKGCPVLAKRCEKGVGEDWHKIAHIPDVNIRD